MNYSKKEYDLMSIIHAPGAVLDDLTMTNPKALCHIAVVKECPEITYDQMVPLMKGKWVDLKRVVPSQHEEYSEVQSGSAIGKMDGKDFVAEDKDLPGGLIYFSHSFPHPSDEKKLKKMGILKLKQVLGPAAIRLPHVTGVGSAVFIVSKQSCALGAHVEDYCLASGNIMLSGSKTFDFVKPKFNKPLRKLLNDIIRKSNDDHHISDLKICKNPIQHKRLFLTIKEKFPHWIETVIQKPKDFFLIPPNVIHQVTADQDSVAVSFNFVDDSWIALMDKGFRGVDMCTCDDNEDARIAIQNELNELKKLHLSHKAHAIASGATAVQYSAELVKNPALELVKEHNKYSVIVYKKDIDLWLDAHPKSKEKAEARMANKDAEVLQSPLVQFSPPPLTEAPRAEAPYRRKKMPQLLQAPVSKPEKKVSKPKYVLRKAKCPECDEEYLKKNLYRHIRRVHCEDKPFRCAHCDKSYTRSDEARACEQRAKQRQKKQRTCAAEG